MLIFISLIFFFTTNIIFYYKYNYIALKCSELIEDVLLHQATRI